MSDFRPIATPTRTVDIMKRYGIQMKKSLGQNFLVEPRILEKMIEVGEVDDRTTVIEIGPGIGALTEYLARHANKVVSFEIDQRFIGILQETLAPYDNVRIVHQDIMTVDFHSDEYAWLKDTERLVVVANLPYYITTPIIMKLIESGLPFDVLVMMMQKEVAERMTAKVNTKAYGSLTLAIENEMYSHISFVVPKNVFIPKPNVDSAVLKLERRENAVVQVEDVAHFQTFIQAAFKQRRKTLWNNLKAYVKERQIDENLLKQAFEQSGIEATRRAESLTLVEFHRLYETMLKIS